MLERFKDCLCNPKCIGKYYKDRFGKAFLIILFFFLLSIVIQAARCYTENPLSDNLAINYSSMVLQNGSSDVAYDANSHRLTGTSFNSSKNGYYLVVLPKEGDLIDLKLDSIAVILAEDRAELYYSSRRISSVSYNDISVASFSFDNIAHNQVVDKHHFQGLIDEVFDSSRGLFQTFNFIDGVASSIVYYFILVFFCYIFSIGVNPTIQKNVRVKLCFYDSCIFFVCQFFAYLFNTKLLIYLALIMPIIYSFITFRHIIKVVVRR